MKQIKSEQLVSLLKQRLNEEKFNFEFDKKHDKLRLNHKKTGKGMELSLPGILAKYNEKQEAAVEEVVYTIEQTFQAMEQEKEQGFQASTQIYPVIRSTSYPKASKEGHAFITTEHTAETRIFYALDLGKTYRFLDESMLEVLQLTEEQIREMARFSVKTLPTVYKKDEVAGNIFYFVNANDGYDASRILNESFLKEMSTIIEGDMTLSVPHQDVLIIGDIRNETGYDVLAQMTMHFFTVGTVPITSLSFIYEDGELEPIFILAKNRVKKEQEKQ
ncbi:DUF1444 domain-containing protein [Lysinibacillus pakistanensis]|uniref:DUF1444 domain-containing protein n=1 Tax=Lysinibacillus pakistanensis TaxID=759811 RepID=A0AAX3WS73_9BACI|nr:DUF1444 domain-containing protein [Lysinibacillus pakistanensis]MDM5229943.1 DUF1444 domain-containing protein [Lysinibacillus pakistanensis]WHY45542.1 DUF1444 domain-containing protein [Lysinibacillus pakistanensis]WHY50550.1 DUF1444 domain-containing protein [Lysinibacillus pakistanensis]